MSGEEQTGGPADTDTRMEEMSRLAALRKKSATATAFYAVVISVLLIGGMLYRYLTEGGFGFLYIAVVWVICDVLWISALLQLRRDRVELATNLILVAIAILVTISAFFDDTILSLLAALLGFPVLLVSALALARSQALRRWSRAIPPLFIVSLLSRQLLNPHPALVDPLNLVLVLVCGAAAHATIGNLAVSILEARKRALATSESIRGALASANTELQEARDEALAASHAKSAFLATMSHELRTPLNAIIGYTELIAEEYASLPLTEDVDRILDASHHLLELINGVLDLSKIEAGRMDVYYETITVDALIRGIADTVRPTIERNHNRLVLNLGRALGTIDSDLTKLRQILLNLSSNAAKFTEGGTVEIVAVEARDAEGRSGLEITVRDTGIGISPEHLESIFNPFTQADASTTRRFGGTGLGLAITRRFAEMLGGTIDVTSAVGEGSCFRLWLPRRAPGAPPKARRDGSSAWRLAQLEADSASMSMSMSVGPVSAAHVLVIDDNPDVHQRLRRLLVKEGFRVSIAASGAEGVALARRDPPDLVTIDILKRSADSWEVLCELKADRELAHVPVLTLSYAAPGTERAPTTLGVVDFVSVPAQPEVLERSLRPFAGDLSEGARGRLLIVDDEPAIRDQLVAVVDAERWEITTASGGGEAIELLRGGPPDLILLDLMMPIIDGFAVLEVLAALPELRDVPVLVIIPRVLTIAELYVLIERARLHLNSSAERGEGHPKDDGEAALRAALARLREADPEEDSALFGKLEVQAASD